MTKVQVAIEDVQRLEQQLETLNRIPLLDIEWTLGGKVLPVSAELIEDFRFTGLSNSWFVLMEGWKGVDSVTQVEHGVETVLVKDGVKLVPGPIMGLEEAALKLHSHLKGVASVWSIGVSVGGKGGPSLYVYTSSKSSKFPETWNDYPVIRVLSDPPTLD